jgi:CBS domain-containing protein
MESNQAVIIVLDRPDGKVLGILTLHDLLRAQVSLGRSNENPGGITV